MIKIYKQEADELLTPVDLIPLKELINIDDPLNSEYRYIREYQITDKIQEAIDDTPFMEIASEALSRSTSAKQMAEKATEDVTTAVIAAEEAVEKVDELNNKVDAYDERINNIDSKTDYALDEAQDAKIAADEAEIVADEAKTTAYDALAKSISNKNEIDEVEKDLNDTKSLLETTRTNLGETINSLNTFKQDQHTIDESQNNTIAELQTEINSKADKSELPDISNLATKDELNSKADKSELNDKQDTLVSGTNIKTINGESILGSGDIEIEGGGIEEAPIDGNQYARKDGSWSIIEGGGSGGGDVYSTRNNTFTGENTFNNIAKFNSILYTPNTSSIIFRDDNYNEWTWNEFVKDGKDVPEEVFYNISYNNKYINKKIEWDNEANAYIAKDVEGYTVIEYYILDATDWGQVLNPEKYSNLEYFSGNSIDDIHINSVGGRYSKTFVNFLTSEIIEDRYAFEQVNEIPIDGDYTSFQDVPAGYKAYKSTGHKTSSTEYMKYLYSGDHVVKYYVSAYQYQSHLSIDGLWVSPQSNIWQDLDVNSDIRIFVQWNSNSVEEYADAGWVLLPEDVTIQEIQYFNKENIPQLLINYYLRTHKNPKLQKYLEFDSNDFLIDNQGDYNYVSLRNSGGGGWTPTAESPLYMNSYGVYRAEGYFTDYEPYSNMRFHHGFVPGGWPSKAPGRGIWYNGLGKPYGQAIISETEYAHKDIFHFYECSGHFIFHKYVYDGDDVILAEITNLGIKEGPDFLKDKYALKSEITPLTPNIVKFGDLSIENGVMSNFSATNYAQFPFLMDLSNKAFEITMQITTGDSTDTQQNILDSKDGLAFAIRSGQFVLAVSNNGTSWAFEARGGEVDPNTTYLVKLSWNRLVYSVKYSTDNGENWAEAINQPFAGHPYPRTMLIGKNEAGNYYFEGQINLNKCTLSVNGQYIWDGMSDAGLLTRLETDLGNVDAAGIDKIKEIVAQDTITLTATLEDGSIKTFEIYGKEL